MISKILGSLGAFFAHSRNRRLIYLLLICLFALGEFLFSGLARRTFVFYANIGGNMVVEDRMLRRSGLRETDVRRYIDEVLLGPVSPDLMPLFPRDTRLRTLMLRDGIVYADLTEAAAMPLPHGGEVFKSLLTLNEGIRRNFYYVRDVRLFIGGNEVFVEDFSLIFGNSADISKTAP
ncbi:MAG: GerMN domain-containing protein [Treponema sp.]|nr:GerMN domain-containing protein [Treponema sp.]